LNIIRIFLFSVLYTEGFSYFDITHLITWYIGSTVLVIGIWLANIKILKIREIPVYADVKRIIREIRKK